MTITRRNVMQGSAAMLAVPAATATAGAGEMGLEQAANSVSAVLDRIYDGNSSPLSIPTARVAAWRP